MRKHTATQVMHKDLSINRNQKCMYIRNSHIHNLQLSLCPLSEVAQPIVATNIENEMQRDRPRRHIHRNMNKNTKNMAKPKLVRKNCEVGKHFPKNCNLPEQAPPPFSHPFRKQQAPTDTRYKQQNTMSQQNNKEMSIDSNRNHGNEYNDSNIQRINKDTTINMTTGITTTSTTSATAQNGEGGSPMSIVRARSTASSSSNRSSTDFSMREIPFKCNTLIGQNYNNSETINTNINAEIICDFDDTPPKAKIKQKSPTPFNKTPSISPSPELSNSNSELRKSLCLLANRLIKADNLD